jgi:hypothetical protein
MEEPLGYSSVAKVHSISQSHGICVVKAEEEQFQQHSFLLVSDKQSHVWQGSRP